MENSEVGSSTRETASTVIFHLAVCEERVVISAHGGKRISHRMHFVSRLASDTPIEKKLFSMKYNIHSLLSKGEDVYLKNNEKASRDPRCSLSADGVIKYFTHMQLLNGVVTNRERDQRPSL